MDDEDKERGLNGDMGSYVEDARGYDSEESENSIVDKVKNAFGGDSDEESREEDDEDLV